MRGKMKISWLLDGWENAIRGFQTGQDFVRTPLLLQLSFLLLTLSVGATAIAQRGLLLRRDGRVISLVPYAPNILRVTISTGAAAATSEPGYGVVAKPATAGWTHEQNAGGDVFRSARMVSRLAGESAE